MADDIDQKLGELRGKLDEVHQFLANEARRARADAEDARKRCDALVARVRASLDEPAPPAA